MSIDEDYYKPIIANDTFNSNCNEYNLYLLEILIKFALCTQRVIILKLYWAVEQMKLLKNFFNLFDKNIRKDYKKK